MGRGRYTSPVLAWYTVSTGEFVMNDEAIPSYMCVGNALTYRAYVSEHRNELIGNMHTIYGTPNGVNTPTRLDTTVAIYKHGYNADGDYYYSIYTKYQSTTGKCAVYLDTANYKTYKLDMSPYEWGNKDYADHKFRMTLIFPEGVPPEYRREYACEAAPLQCCWLLCCCPCLCYFATAKACNKIADAGSTRQPEFEPAVIVPYKCVVPGAAGTGL